MTQPLIVDQKAMAEKAMAELVSAISILQERVTPTERDLTRAQVRAFRSRMRPLANQLKTLQFKQRMIQQQIDALGSADAS